MRNEYSDTHNCLPDAIYLNPQDQHELLEWATEYRKPDPRLVELYQRMMQKQEKAETSIAAFTRGFFPSAKTNKDEIEAMSEYACQHPVESGTLSSIFGMRIIPVLHESMVVTLRPPAEVRE